MSFPQGISFT